MIARPQTLRERFGICQWFHFADHTGLEQAVSLLRELGLRHLRTGISWADFHRPGGREWYDEVFAACAEFELLVCVWHTPPSLSEGGTCASPPQRLLDYADFIDEVITLYGSFIGALEIWNEPNNTYKWNFPTYDPRWAKFAGMAGAAAHWARHRGVTTVLGGMMPVDPHWAQIMKQQGVLQHLDVVGIHGFPGMWWPDRPNWEWFSHWTGWEDKINSLRPVTGRLPVWITETGFATWDHAKAAPGHYATQVHYLQQAVELTVPRTYWYSLLDLDPEREAIEGFHVDENEYHLGLVTHAGVRKPAFYALLRAMAQDSSRAAADLLNAVTR